MYIGCNVIKDCTKFERNRTIRGWVIDWFNKFFGRRRYVTLWPWCLTSWPWTPVIHRLSYDQTLHRIGEKSNNPRRSYSDLKVENVEAVAIFDLNESWFSIFSGLRGPIMHNRVNFQHNLTMRGWIIDLVNFRQRYVTLWPWPLPPWPWTFKVHRVSSVQILYKTWAKSNNPRRSYWRLSLFSPSNFSEAPNLRTVLKVREPNLSKLGKYIGLSSTVTKFVSAFRYLAAFQTREAQRRSSSVANWGKIWHHFSL